IPNVASDTQNIRLNADFIVQMMNKRGISARLLEVDGSPPAVYAEWKVPEAKRTLLFYAHYDGQPADPKQWTITSPWQPVLRTPGSDSSISLVDLPVEKLQFPAESRIYARSASDDKAGIITILPAFEAALSQKIPLTSNLKFFFEGEEEAGSPHLDAITKRYGELLQADAWVICDGPVHRSGRKTVVFGVRGDVNVDITIYGAKRPLHSGHYGNWAPNPAMQLAALLESMKDEQGRVTIDGWYDDVEPLTAVERQSFQEIPNVDRELQKELGIAKPEGSGQSLVELINLPSLNVNGINSADVGEKARNVIPTTASATLDLRLVKGNDYIKQVEKLVRHVQSKGYYVMERDPNDAERGQYPLIAKITAGPGYNAYRAPMDLPISTFIMNAVQSTVRDSLVKIPSLGGSLPLIILHENLGTESIIVPIANYDNNQHAEDENIRLQNLWDGIETFAALMTNR
ncbi:MAG TPA: M20/M25/M40 family metallo-hydrolase, partial [Acidobacteriota bacterium]